MDRDRWREAVFARDGHACVRCGRRAGDVKLDAHHLMERRLFGAPGEPLPGGYAQANGVTLCDASAADGGPSCHMLAEGCVVLPDELRAMAGIDQVVLPVQLLADEQWDKWGSPVLADGTRGTGELFWEEPVQKVLRQMGTIDLYRTKVKHSRTPHAPWSPNHDDDDILLDTTAAFDGREVVVTEKLDGENCSVYRDAIHARSLDSGYHQSRTWVRALQARVGYELPAGWRLVGENMQAVHSVRYEKLPGYFLLFAIFDERNVCLAWDEVLEWAQLLELPTVPVIWRGTWDEQQARQAAEQFRSPYTDESEGYVIRVADAFAYRQFGELTAKVVRKNHVRTDQHWMAQEMVQNGLA